LDKVNYEDMKNVSITYDEIKRAPQPARYASELKQRRTERCILIKREANAK